MASPVRTPGDTTGASTKPAVDDARAAVTTSLTKIGSSMDADLQARARDIHANSAAIARQEKALARDTAKLAKQANEGQKLVDRGLKKINEIGDIQNWAELIERDLLVVEETLRLADEKRDRKEHGPSEQKGAVPSSSSSGS